MKLLDEVIQNKLLISKNYERVFYFINPLDLELNELTIFIIYNMECENVIEFIKLVKPFLCYISSLLKYEYEELYINDRIYIKLEFHESQGEYILDVLKINDENGIERIRECIQYFNGFYLTLTRKFDAYFVIYDDSEENDSYNDHINTNKTFKTEECLLCYGDKPDVLFCGCGHLCICKECIKYYESYKCPICKNINKNIRIII